MKFITDIRGTLSVLADVGATFMKIHIVQLQGYYSGEKCFRSQHTIEKETNPKQINMQPKQGNEYIHIYLGSLSVLPE